MSINSIECESHGSITQIPKDLIDKFSKLPAVLPPYSIITEMYIHNINGNLTLNRAINIGNCVSNNYYTSSYAYGISTNLLNNSKIIKLKYNDNFNISLDSENKLTISCDYVDDINVGRVAVIIKYRSLRSINPMPGVDLSQ